MIDLRQFAFLILTACLLTACKSGGGAPEPVDNGQSSAEQNTPAQPETPAPEPETPAPEPETPAPEPEVPAPEPEPEPEPESTTGKSGLFIGHSFFRPAATNFARFAADAGLGDHAQQVYFSGGATGTPAQLWANATKRADIQALLDEGGIEVFGMTYHGDEPEIDGYVLWTEYALQENPDVEIFVALPWATQPHTLSGQQHEDLWEDFHNSDFHALIDELRAEFPETNFYCLPYGAMAHDLQKLWDSGNLADITALQGPDETSLYTDNLGHPGKILEVAGGLVWLNAIYDVDLAEFDNGLPFQADLNTIAADIMAMHDPVYDRDN